MPRLTKSVPKYRKHRASGQAVVTLSGVDHYLGPHGTKASRIEYDRITVDWLANGRNAPIATPEDDGLSVAEISARYWQFARGYYQKDGDPTSTLDGVKQSLWPLKRLYGRTAGKDFGPLAFKAVRALAYKWIRILFRCWMDRTRYNEAKYLDALRARNSPILEFLAAQST